MEQYVDTQIKYYNTYKDQLARLALKYLLNLSIRLQVSFYVRSILCV